MLFFLHQSYHAITHLMSIFPVMAVLAFLLAPVALQAQADKIHPFTQQLYTQWLDKLDAAETISKPGSDPEKALPVLEATEEWFSEKKQTLERHPDYKIALKRQLLLRIKQARITAISALAFAETALKNQKTDFLDGRGGAYEQLEKADKLVQSLIQVLGPDQQPIKELMAYVEQVRGKVQEKVGQIKSGGVNMATAAGAKLQNRPLKNG